ncbi:retrovirus-related pol polyprotein from type-1 retrotransposable element r2 [Plakobranchus ocellatus]|uniref:Retrovirus-related pol polyprotein from type-1 retrotransposable element r2 n=1 Tax=Plakobranchus ocellatus TaxID=259542 RepID=A0AAV3YUP3_9GAST|nr:retrovirus-related pol polyprotein from type-1 retrotransposable element r2 [Plakobranchus ocellatus]
MYWEQTAAMKIENKTSTFQDIKRGVRQGCVLSPDLFSLYSEIIMRNLENHPGIKVGGQNINNLRYAHDTVLIAENKEDLQKLLNIVEEESRKKGLELNSKKTEVMSHDLRPVQMILTLSRMSDISNHRNSLKLLYVKFVTTKTGQQNYMGILILIIDLKFSTF